LGARRKDHGPRSVRDASRFPEPIIECHDDGITVDTLWITKLPERSAEPAHLDDICRDVAAKVQAELERGVLHLCKLLHRATAQPRLCLSGRVGLNTVTNGASCVKRRSQSCS
jgi:carbamoyltransferase